MMRLVNHIGCMVAFVALTTFAAPAHAQEATDHLGIPGPIAFDGESYLLTWSSQPSDGYTKQDYLPAGQTTEAYDSMILVETLEADLAPIAMASAQVEMLNARKSTDPLVTMDLIQNGETGEVLLDFLLSERDEAGEYIVEWNAYRYAAIEGADGAPAGLLFGISHRAYGDAAVKEFLQGLQAFRGEQIQVLSMAPLPEL